MGGARAVLEDENGGKGTHRLRKDKNLSAFHAPAPWKKF